MSLDRKIRLLANNSISDRQLYKKTTTEQYYSVCTNSEEPDDKGINYVFYEISSNKISNPEDVLKLRIQLSERYNYQLQYFVRKKEFPYSRIYYAWSEFDDNINQIKLRGEIETIETPINPLSFINNIISKFKEKSLNN
jgi:hypothetical protein